MLQGLNHITLAVKDLDASLYFYQEVLEMKGHARWDGGAYLSAGSLWLCLSVDESQPAMDYSHIAFDVDKPSFDAMIRKMSQYEIVQWKSNSSEGDSLYLLDPDGHKLELHVGSLKSRLAALKSKPYSGLKWL